MYEFVCACVCVCARVCVRVCIFVQVLHTCVSCHIILATLNL